MTASPTSILATTGAPLREESIKDTVKIRRDSFNLSRLRNLSSSFSKQRCSHSRHVSFDFDKTEVFHLPEELDRSPMFVTHQDKVTTADDVEETCYKYNDSDFIHPYVLELCRVWDQCANAGNSTRPIEFEPADLYQMINTKARGLEKKLNPDMKRYREGVLKQVTETQRSYKHLPFAARAKMIKSRYKKASGQAKSFALTLAQGDALLAQSLYRNPVAA